MIIKALNTKNATTNKEIKIARYQIVLHDLIGEIIGKLPPEYAEQAKSSFKFNSLIQNDGSIIFRVSCLDKDCSQDFRIPPDNDQAAIKDVCNFIIENMQEQAVMSFAKKKNKKDDPCWKNYEMIGTKKKNGKDVPNCVKKESSFYENTYVTAKEEKSEAWQRKDGKNPEGGLNEEGRKSYEKANPGSDLKPPVSKEEAAKSETKSKRRKSFCARMKGMKKKLTSKETASDPDSRINKSLRKWDC